MKGDTRTVPSGTRGLCESICGLHEHLVVNVGWKNICIAKYTPLRILTIIISIIK